MQETFQNSISFLLISNLPVHFSKKKYYIKTYRNRVWDLLESFLAINIVSIPKKYNQITNALARKGTHCNHVHHKRGIYGFNVLCRPFVPDTIKFL